MKGRVPWLGMGLLAMLLIGWTAARALHTLPMSILPACPMKTHLGIPCASCGITRCVLALSEGRWSDAFHWHPVAVLLGLSSPLLVAWDLRRAWKGLPYPPLPDSLAARLGVAGLLAGTWLLQILRGI